MDMSYIMLLRIVIRCMNKPHIIENFIDPSDAAALVKFIEESNFFNYGHKNLSKFLRYGKDIHFKEDDKSLLPKEIKSILNKYYLKIVDKASELFQLTEIYMTQAWLVKRLPGHFHGLHDDYEDGDEHIQFGGVVYLNDTGKDGGGEIAFPKINFEYKPKGLDVIIFNSRDIMYTHGVKLVNKDRYSISFWTTGDKNFALEI